MIDDRNDEVILERARRVGLRRSPIYTYLTWLSAAGGVCLVIFSLIDVLYPPVENSSSEVLLLVLAVFAVPTMLLDVLIGWFLARRWGVARLLKKRTRMAEQAADRNDHHAVLAALDPVKRFWGTEEIFLTARSRIALRKAGEL